MALPDGLNEAEIADYLATLRGPYEQVTRVEVLTNERQIITTLPAAVLGGQVDCVHVEADMEDEDKSNQTIEVSRLARGVTLYDPTNTIAIDSGSPSDGALYLDRCIRIVVSIRGQLRWYDNSVFTGRLTDLDRQGTVVTLEAAGMETFGQGAAFTPETIRTPKTKVAAFRELMYDTGEVDAWMDVPMSTRKLVRSKVISRDTRRWDKAFFIMASMGRLCFYDGHGRLRTPLPSKDPVIDFSYGDDGLLLDEPEVKHSIEDFRNAWWEQGSTIGKNVDVAVAIAESHPLAPLKIGRNGKPLYLMGDESNSDLRTNAKARVRAFENLERAGIYVQVRGESRPVWHLSPFDWASLTTDTYSTPFPVKEFSLPLAGGAMTLGYRQNLTTIAAARIRGN